LLTKLRELFTPAYWCHGGRPWYGSLGVSTLVHVCLIVALSFWWTLPPHGIQLPGVETRWSPEDLKAPLTRLPQLQKDFKPTQSDAGGKWTVSVFQHNPQELKVSAPSSRSAVPNWLGELLVTEDLAEDVGFVSNDLAGGGIGAGEGNASGDGVGKGFFGIHALGQSFVYVVDCSKSMNRPHPSEAKTRFRRLKLELVKSIATLKPDMKFFIIFFNRHALPMPARSLQPALPLNQNQYLRWAATVRAQGDTDPREALSYALRLRPDIIYFLTDGDFQHSVVQDLKKLQQKNVDIHTFAFGNRDAEDLLKAIASANGGEYHFVP